MATQPPGGAFPDAAAIPLADGRADDRPEEVCQTGGAAGIYGMISARRGLVQNREILRRLPCTCRWAVFYGKNGFCRGFSAIYAAVAHVLFWEKLY